MAFGRIDGRPVDVTCSDDQTVSVWDLIKKKEVDQLRIGMEVTSVVLRTTDRFGIELM